MVWFNGAFPKTYFININKVTIQRKKYCRK